MINALIRLTNGIKMEDRKKIRTVNMIAPAQLSSSSKERAPNKKAMFGMTPMKPIKNVFPFLHAV